MKHLSTLLGAIAFYTCIPISPHWRLNFHGIATWAPLVGMAIGGLLGLLDWGLQSLGMAVLLRSALLVIAWIAITGGLHLDGAIDTADGLAVFEPTRRLQVMADSRTGAFGVMAAIAIVLLKTTALADGLSYRWLALILAAGWGRWGQLMAISHYPYLKPEGKGAFLKAAIRSPWDATPSLLLLLGLSGLYGYLSQQWLAGVEVALAGGAIALLAGAYFNHKLGGHTGDTYGATVEWTEAFLLCVLTVIR